MYLLMSLATSTPTAARRLALLALALLALLAACAPSPPAASESHSGADHEHAAEAMPHLHGLAFSADGRQLIVPAHIGLRVYEGGAWHAPDVAAHDYMGFAATDEGFYSSGHPAPGSPLANPLGLVRSDDGGATLEPLAFQGESDFHLLGVGYRSHAIYLVNPAANAQMQPGPYASFDRGASWTPFAARGVSAPPYQIAVHPDEPGRLAMATDAGLLQSVDYGASFALVGPAAPATAAAYSLDGRRLLFAAATLSALDLASGATTALGAPQLAADDTITYVASSPVDAQTMALATLGRDIFMSSDGGASWQQIAEAGAAVAAGQ